MFLRGVGWNLINAMTGELPDLLRKLCKIDGIVWIRLMYCYEERITDELIDVMIR